MAKTKICAVAGCSKFARSRGLCSAHYRRLWRNGDPTAGQTPKGRPLTWLKESVGFDGDDCLIWPFARLANGYGALFVDGRYQIASRYMCLLSNGQPPRDWYQAAHTCGNGKGGCVNPAHLRWATPRENSLDRNSHGTMRRGESHHMARISDRQVNEIIELGKEMTQSQIAKIYGVAPSLVSVIISGKHRAINNTREGV